MKLLLFLFLLLASPWSEAANYMCGKDLNGDGFVDAENETASCVAGSAGQYCPIGREKCNSESFREEEPPIPKCPPGSTLNGDQTLCIGGASWASYWVPLGRNVLHYIKGGDAGSARFTFISDNNNAYGKVVGSYTLGSEIYLDELDQNGRVIKNNAIKARSGNLMVAEGGNCFFPLCGANQYEIQIKIGNATDTSPTYECRSEWTYDSKNHTCYIESSTNVCPINKNIACVQDGSHSYCSPNPCVDLETQHPIENGSFDDKMLIDDGRRDESGACLDQLYIFNGKHSECRPSGFDTAFKNCCKSKGSALHDGAGSAYSMYGGVQTVKKLYSIGKIAHTAYTAQVAAGVPVDFAAELAVSAAKQQAALMFNPTTMAISVAMYFVMDYLMQACEQPDLEAAMMNDSGYCHYVGSYCKKEWPLIGCVQKAQSFCCFNSKLARIIHQQGRPQLTTFNSWGSAESPDCRGFKPEEFQSLDFRRINLQEYYEDLVHQTQSEMAATIQKVSTEFYEKTISE